MNINRMNYLWVILLLLTSVSFSQEVDPQKAIISVERIWDRADHSAFTDLIRFTDRFYCAFREGSGHIPGINGSVRVISSRDGQNWSSVAHLIEKDVDLRDPKLSITPRGRIMVVMAGCFYEGSKFIRREPKVSFSNTSGRNFSKPRIIKIDEKISSDEDWLWRVTWFKNTGYGVVYQANRDESKTHLVKTTNAINYQHVVTFDLKGHPNETTIRFTPEGKMIALVRREGEDRKGFIGTSEPSYVEWTWNQLNGHLGGPDFIRLSNGELLCGTRDYREEGKRKTILAKITIEGEFNPILALPSGGDTSYPGLVTYKDKLYVSYYSSHQEKTAIYLAKIWLDRVE
jgi:hypothetical protein